MLNLDSSRVHIKGIPVHSSISLPLLEKCSVQKRGQKMACGLRRCRLKQRTLHDYSPEVDKTLTIHCYQPESGYCACVLTEDWETEKEQP